MHCLVMGSLNPFEFRAGLKQTNHSKAPKVGSLNPFEFRAGLKREREAFEAWIEVLIPLNSGLA